MTLIELQAFATSLPGHSVFPPWVVRPVTLAPPGTPIPAAAAAVGRLKQSVTVVGRP